MARAVSLHHRCCVLRSKGSIPEKVPHEGFKVPDKGSDEALQVILANHGWKFPKN